MSEPNMGFVVLGPVLGPEDNEIRPVSNCAVHLIAQGRKSEPNSFDDIKKIQTWMSE